jgi:hypothetical protein
MDNRTYVPEEKLYVPIRWSLLQNFMKKNNYTNEEEAMRDYIQKIGVREIYNEEEYKDREIMFWTYYQLKDNDIVKFVHYNTYRNNIDKYLDK